MLIKESKLRPQTVTANGNIGLPILPMGIGRF